MGMSLILRNPHSVLAVLETRPRDVIKVCVHPKSSHESWDRVIALAKSKKIPIVHEFLSAKKNTDSEESSRQSKAEAWVKERSPISLEEWVKVDENRTGGLWLVLDSLQDPHNVGAIFRAAAFFGVKGIMMTQERSAPLTPIVYDVASGGVEYVPFTIQTNLQRAFEVAKKEGFWILGSSEHATDSYATIPQDRSWMLVLGNEEKGMRRLTEESCDLLCQIPARGKVKSLNVSVAAGILMGHFTSEVNPMSKKVMK
jgi:23S rRNA (guanosine2251-2'-O)-methyltransferase